MSWRCPQQQRLCRPSAEGSCHATCDVAQPGFERASFASPLGISLPDTALGLAVGALRRAAGLVRCSVSLNACSSAARESEDTFPKVAGLPCIFFLCMCSGRGTYASAVTAWQLDGCRPLLVCSPAEAAVQLLSTVPVCACQHRGALSALVPAVLS